MRASRFHLPSELSVYTAGHLNVRAEPHAEAQILAVLPAGETLAVVGDAGQARARLGREGEWLQVQTASSQTGFVAAWLVQSSGQTFPPSDLVVYPVDTVNLRAGPATAFELLASLAVTDPLIVLGDAGNARDKIGRPGEWLQVQTEKGLKGFVAASLFLLPAC